MASKEAKPTNQGERKIPLYNSHLQMELTKNSGTILVYKHTTIGARKLSMTSRDVDANDDSVAFFLLLLVFFSKRKSFIEFARHTVYGC